MERITKRIEDENTLLTEVGDTACKCFCDNYTLSGCWECPVGKAIEKLADYEDAEEQGLLVRLPCKLNGTLYSVNYSNKTIAENTIIKISINDHVKRFYCIDDNLRERIFFSRRIGENVFLTREEAEKKLEEMKHEQ